MKIAIDARFLGPEGTGIGRYVEKLVENLQRIDKINHYYILLRQSNFDKFTPANPNFEKILADARWYSFKEQFLMPRILKSLKPDLVHIPHFNIAILYFGKFVVTIHDLTKSDFSSVSSSTRNAVFYWIKHLVYLLTLGSAVKRAKYIITPSNSTKKKLIADLKIKESKIRVTYESADEKFFKWGNKPIDESRFKEILAKYHIKSPYIIYVGNAYPYKNLDRLLEALKILPDNLSLVNPCTRSVFYDRLAARAKELGVATRVILPGYVPDEELSILYRAAEAYIFPTLSEGFGIPVLEAMASKLPVICSDIPVLKEICGDNAVYFDPLSVRDISSKIAQVINDKNLRERMVREGLERAHQFSWRKMAAQTLQVYDEAVK